MRLNFKIQGMTCDACAKLAAKKISKIEGAEDIRIDAASGSAELESNHEISLAAINDALEGSGYKAV